MHEEAHLPAEAQGAIIIPAHDEEAVIARTLAMLAPLTAVEGIEIIVVCNGCRDDTAAQARRFPRVTVIETDRGSKTGAMNLGDEVATAWPRLYLDADIEIAPSSVIAVFAALLGRGVRAARAPHVYEAASASWPVRAYYRARSRVPADPRRMWGAGGYATNAPGHERFGRFADVTADDSWFDEQFADEEKRIVSTDPMIVRTPRTTAALVAILTRQRRGYVEIGVAAETTQRGRGLLSSIRGIRSAADAACYVVLTLVARRRARRALARGRTPEWETDRSSRAFTEAPHGG